MIITLSLSLDFRAGQVTERLGFCVPGQVGIGKGSFFQAGWRSSQFLFAGQICCLSGDVVQVRLRSFWGSLCSVRFGHILWFLSWSCLKSAWVSGLIQIYLPGDLVLVKSQFSWGWCAVQVWGLSGVFLLVQLGSFGVAVLVMLCLCLGSLCWTH